MAVDVVRLRGALGAAIKYGNPERAADLRAELATALIANHIEKLLDDAPALSVDRAARLHAMVARYTETDRELVSA